MALPTSRDETATSASNVHANLLNAIQDAIIALYNLTGLGGDETIMIPPSAASTIEPLDEDTIPAVRDFLGYWTNPSGFGLLSVNYPVIVPVGRRIKSWRLDCYKSSNASRQINARLYRNVGAGASGGGSDTPIGLLQSNTANAPGVVQLAQAGLTEDVVAGQAYTISAFTDTGGAAGDIFGVCRVTYGRP
jgi:hypothetical protein